VKSRGPDFWNDPTDPRHGTTNGYSNLKCRCQPCRDAWGKAVQRAKERRASQPVPDHLHGTENAYGNYGCRCRPCTDVWSAACLARQQRRLGMSA
jgi:hypothetical protein